MQEFQTDCGIVMGLKKKTTQQKQIAIMGVLGVFPVKRGREYIQLCTVR